MPSLYADFGDFHLWRVRPLGALLVGGFARATRLRQADLTPDATAVAAICRRGGWDRQPLQHRSSRCDGGHRRSSRAHWRMVTADVDGADLAQDERVLRVHWSAPVQDAGAVSDRTGADDAGGPGAARLTFFTVGRTWVMARHHEASGLTDCHYS